MRPCGRPPCEAVRAFASARRRLAPRAFPLPSTALPTLLAFPLPETALGWVLFLAACLIVLLVVIKMLATAFSGLAWVLGSKESTIGRWRARTRAAGCRKSDPGKAGDIYRNLGDLDEALACYEEGHIWMKAADVHMMRGQRRKAAKIFEKAGDLLRAADTYVELKDYEEAAGAYLKLGNKIKAAKLFEEAGQLDKAIPIYREINRLDRAAELLEKAGQPLEAATLAEETFFRKIAEVTGSGFAGRKEIKDLRDRIDSLYRTAGEVEKLLQFYLRAGMLGEAAEVCIERSELDRAADLYMQAGEQEKAALLFEQSGEKEKAARILGDLHFRGGRFEEAAKCYETAGDREKAAECFERSGDWARAAGAYEELGNHSQAAWLWAKAEQPARAATLYENAGEYRSAIQCYEMVNDRQGVARILKKSSQYLRSGEIYYELGEIDEASETLQRITPDSPHYKEAASLLGVIHFEKGMYRTALQKFDEGVVVDSDTSKPRLDVLYYRGRTLEELGRTDEALECYEAIAEIDTGFEDAARRVGELKRGERPAPSRLKPIEGGDTAGKKRKKSRGGDTARLEPEEAAAQEEAAAPLAHGTGGDTVVDLASPAGNPATPRIDGLLLNKGRYKILEEIGRGGMGVVYKVRDTLLDRIVAYKVLSSQISDFPQAVDHFLREAKSAARMNHPNIVTLYDFGEIGGKYFMTLEYVAGRDLRAYSLFNGRPAVKEGLDIVREICDGLRYAHSMNVIHRDIKPSNVMITDLDHRLKILDFGLAKVIEDVGQSASGVLGTPWYMSPEQVKGEDVDHRSDLYSVGVLMYELITGELPFTGRDFGYHHVHTPPRDPKEIMPELPDDVVKLILKLLEKDPERRHQSAAEVMEEIKGTVAGMG